MELEINGKKYRKREKQPSKLNGRITSLILFAAVTGGFMPSLGMKSSLPDGIDIVNEYMLIQNKASNLSSRQREEVVFRFEKEYVLIDLK